MNEQTPYYLKKLRDEFTSRTERRANYSLRTFARYLGIEAASLSGVLRGNRRLPKAKAQTIVSKLNLSPEEESLFLQSNEERVAAAALPKASNHARYRLSEETHFRIISEWEHYAILSLIEIDGFESSPKWISKRLGVPELRVHTCLANLSEANLIVVDSGRISATHIHLSTTEDVPSQALRKARKQDLDLAMNAVDEIAVELRDLSSCTMTVKTEDLKELKAIIRDFRLRFMDKAESKTGNEVYKLAVQFFPLTKLENENEDV